ncbi:MAG: LuxR C-terminal-related transcriptional regulator [Desulfobacterales bacterium]
MIKYNPVENQSPKGRFPLHDSFARIIFDSLSANIAIVDHKGIILATNRSWQKFAGDNDMKADFDSVGQNYLDICKKATGKDAQISHRAAEGIQSVINGDTQEFIFDYPCHSPTQKHWFNMRVIRLTGTQPVKIIVSHEEITALKLIEESLRKSQKLLIDQKKDLEESNIALKVILKQRELDRVDLEQRVLENIKELVFPYLEKLKNSNLGKSQKAIVDIIEVHLKDIISPFLKRLTSLSKILTPQELQVATMIKDGKSTKEIADMLNVSISTINFHRKNLRVKFGLNNKKANLRSYLLSLT